jgi:hypothetical protein
MQKGWTLRSSGLQCVAPGACQGPRLSSPPTSSRLRRASAASTPPGATTLSVPNPPRNGAGVQPRSGLWKLPDLWTRKRTRAHKVLGRRQTAAGAHSYHRPQPRPLQLLRQRPCLTQAPSLILTAAHPEWPVFKRSRLAGFQRSVRPVSTTTAAIPRSRSGTEAFRSCKREAPSRSDTSKKSRSRQRARRKASSVLMNAPSTSVAR